MWTANWERDHTFDLRAAELVAGCEAFLRGRYHELLVATGRRVPAWAWLNVLAHGTLAELREVATGQRWGSAGSSCPRLWREALAFMASEVLDAAGDETGLRSIQQSRLVPLELMLADQYGFGALTPARLAGAVMTALQPDPSSPHDRPPRAGGR